MTAAAAVPQPAALDAEDLELVRLFAAAWMDQAACRPANQGGQHEDLDWFPPPGKPKAALAAINICNTECPVQTDCLRYALTIPMRYGIWGGMGRQPRRELRGQLAREGTILTLRQCQLPGCKRHFAITSLSSKSKYCTPLHRTMAKRRRRSKALRPQDITVATAVDVTAEPHEIENSPWTGHLTMSIKRAKK